MIKPVHIFFLLLGIAVGGSLLLLAGCAAPMDIRPPIARAAP